MTAVLLLADVPSTGYVAGVAAERVLLGPRPPAVSATGFLDLTEHRIDRQGAVLALYPSWHEGPAWRFIRAARALLDTDRIAAVSMDLPPLALSLVADQLAYLAPYLPSGLLATLASRLPKEILAGAWLRSVTGLSHIGTSVGQHMKSYLPGGAFMVTATPRQDVHRISGNSPVGELDYRPANPVQVLATQQDADTEWFEKKLMGVVRPSVVRFVNPQPLSSEYWGTKKYVEYVAFSGHPEALSHAANSTKCKTCRWCGEPVGVPICPFCGTARVRLARKVPKETSYGTPIASPPADEPALPPLESEHAPPAPSRQASTPGWHSQQPWPDYPGTARPGGGARQPRPAQRPAGPTPGAPPATPHPTPRQPNPAPRRRSQGPPPPPGQAQGGAASTPEQPPPGRVRPGQQAPGGQGASPHHESAARPDSPHQEGYPQWPTPPAAGPPQQPLSPDGDQSQRGNPYEGKLRPGNEHERGEVGPLMSESSMPVSPEIDSSDAVPPTDPEGTPKKPNIGTSSPLGKIVASRDPRNGAL